MKKLNLTVLLSVLMLCPVTLQTVVNGQSDLTFGADAVSRYIWRGINLGGASPHVQPYIEYNAGNSGLAIGFWGSYGTGSGSAGTEADLYISYTPVSYLTFTVTDYFFPSDLPFSTDRYFDYSKEGTGHTIEGMASFNGTESFPVSILFAINIYGADGTDADGNNYNAKYIELGYSNSFREYSVEAFAGIALDNPETELGAVGWYGDSRGLINLGLTLGKTARISETVAIPVFSSLIFNPQAGNIYMVVGVSF